MTNILSRQEVLDVQVELLSAIQEKHALSKYYTPIHDASETDYKTNTNLKNILKKQYDIDEAKWCGDTCNSIFRVLTAVFMRLFFTNNNSIRNDISDDDAGGRSDLLEHLKCTLYSSELDLQSIKNNPISSLNSTDMKKIIVQLFQVLKYNKGGVEPILDKYPIVQQIFILFFRTVLMKFSQGLGQQNYLTRVESDQIIENLLDYFDITYQFRKGLYIIYEDNLYIYVQPGSSEIVYGQYKSYDNTLKSKFQENKDFHFEEHELDFLEEDKKETIISTPTPFFAEFNEDEMNFASKPGHAKNRRKQSLHQMKKQLSQRISQSNKSAIRQQQQEDEKPSQLKPDNQLKVNPKPRKMSEYVSNRSSIQIENEQSLKRESHEVSNGRTNPNIYFDIDQNWERNYKKKLEAIQSPIPSSPEGDSIRDTLKNLQIQDGSHFIPIKKNMKNQQQVSIRKAQDSQSIKSDKQLSKYRKSELDEELFDNVSKSRSNIFQSEDGESKNQHAKHPKNSLQLPKPGSKNTYDEYDGSIGSSCACSEIKSKRNFLNSNVVDININPDFKKKSQPELKIKKSPLTFCKVHNKEESKNKGKKLFSQKTPDLIFKRPASHNTNSFNISATSKPSQSSSLQSNCLTNEQAHQRYQQRPKVSFTYTKKDQGGYYNIKGGGCQFINENRMVQNHMYTQPCNSGYHNRLRSYRQHYRVPSQYQINTKFLGSKPHGNPF